MTLVNQASGLRKRWSKSFFWIILSFIVAATGWHLASCPSSPSSRPQTPSSVPIAVLTAQQNSRMQLPNGDVRVVPAGPEGLVKMTEFVEMSQQLNRPDRTPKDDLEALHTLLDSFRRSKAWTNQPASENEEFIAPLCGINPLRLVFMEREHPALNKRGQLLDRWGAPYHFHHETGDALQIRSSGPDGKLFTPDDVVNESSESE